MNCLDHGQAPFSVPYAVIRTNADYEEVEVMFENFDRDIAESKAVKFFKASGFNHDFMVMDRKTFEVVGEICSEKTRNLRGECRG